MKKRVYIVVGVISAVLIVACIMLSTKMQEKNTQTIEIKGKVEEINIQALETEPQIPETWDLNKVSAVLSLDNEYVPVPKGFTASKAVGEQEVNKGFVIYEGEVAAVNPEEWTEQEAWQASLDKNQFVWIPVKDTSRIYETDSNTGKKKAKLRNFTATGISAIGNDNTDKRREPGILPKDSGGPDYAYDRIKYCLPGYNKYDLYKELQLEFDKSMKSIEKYGGFYIGRFETGNINKEVAVVQRMNTDISNTSGNVSNTNWYDMYRRIKNMNTQNNVQISMIWGCLWDETLQWLIDTGAKNQAEIATDSRSWGNYAGTTFTYTSTSRVQSRKTRKHKNSNRK